MYRHRKYQKSCKEINFLYSFAVTFGSRFLDRISTLSVLWDLIIKQIEIEIVKRTTYCDSKDIDNFIWECTRQTFYFER